jgi:hypothetical protein
MNKLVELIKSMTKSEKRYFKMSANLQKGEKNYTLLMDAISSQKKYNEGLILKKFSDKKFSKNLGVAKSDLYKLIMNSLRQYHSQNSVSSRLTDMLKDAEILYRKGLYLQCGVIIKKGISLAKKSDKFLFLSMFISRERILNQAHYYNLNESAINESWKEVNINLQKAVNYNNYWKVSSLCFLYYKKYSLSGDKKSNLLLREMESDSLLKDESNARSFLARQLFYNTHVFFSQVNEDLRSSLYYAEKIVRLFEDNPTILQDNLKSYIIVFHNYISILIDAGKFEKALIQIDLMQDIPKAYPKQKQKTINMLIFRYQTYLELSLVNKTGEFNRVLSKIDKIEESLTRYSEDIGIFSIHKIYYQLSYMYFLMEDYNSSQICCYKILQHQGFDWSKESFHINLIYLIAHYELGNTDLQESIGRQLYRMFRTGEDFSDFELILSGFVRKLPLKYKEKDIKKLYLETWTALNNLPDKLLNKITMDNFNIRIWLKCKIENLNFTATMLKKQESK